MKKFLLLLALFILPSRMEAAITQSLLTSNQVSSATSATTASITPTANNLILVSVVNRISNPPTTPTVACGTCTGLTFVQVATATFRTVAAPVQRITVFRAMGASPGAGTVVISFGAASQTEIGWHISQFGGVNTGGTNGSAAVVQAITGNSDDAPTMSVTLGTLADAANNATFGVFSNNGSDFTVGSGYTLITQQSGSGFGRFMTEWKVPGSTTVNATSVGGATAAIGIEIGAAGGAGGGSGFDTTGFISYWPIDEASGNRADKVVATGNTLTSNGTGGVGQSIGKVYANAGQFTAPNAQYLSHADNASLSVGGTASSIALWVYLDTTTLDFMLVSKDDQATNREYFIFHDVGLHRFTYTTFTGSGATGRVDLSANTFGAPSAGTWYFIVAVSDLSTNKISVNAGTQDSVAAVNAGWNGAAPFEIGARNGPDLPHNGRIGPVMFFKRALSAAEITTLYNNGAGLTYEGILGTGVIMHPLLSGNNTANQTSYTTASTTITANRLAVLAYQNSRDLGLSAGGITVTSTGATWHEFPSPGHISYHTTGTPTRRNTLFYTMVGSNQTGALTIDHGAGNTQDGAAWSLVEFEGVQTGGTDGSAAIQTVNVSGNSGGSSATTLTCSLAAFADAGNATFGAFARSAATAFTPGSGLIGIHDVNYATPSNDLMTLWRNGADLMVDSTWSGGADCGCVAAEIRRLGAAGGGMSPALLSAIQALQEAEDDDFNN